MCTWYDICLTFVNCSFCKFLIFSFFLDDNIQTFQSWQRGSKSGIMYTFLDNMFISKFNVCKWLNLVFYLQISWKLNLDQPPKKVVIACQNMLKYFEKYRPVTVTCIVFIRMFTEHSSFIKRSHFIYYYNASWIARWTVNGCVKTWPIVIAANITIYTQCLQKEKTI